MRAKSISVQLRADDYLSASYLHSRRQMGLLASIAFVASAVAGVAGNSFSDLNNAFEVVVAMLPLVFLVLAFLGARYLLTPWRTRRIYRQQKAMQRPRTLSWDDDYLTSEGADSTARIPWSDFIRWRENDQLFMLYLSDVAFHIVTKRAFNDADEISAFRRLVQQKIAPRPGVRRKASAAEVFS